MKVHGIVLISLPGHTRGHAAVAVDTGDRWLLHAGDAFYHHGTLDGHSRVPAVVRAGETLLSYDLKKVRDNHARLAELHQRRPRPEHHLLSRSSPVRTTKGARVAA